MGDDEVLFRTNSAHYLNVSEAGILEGKRVVSLATILAGTPHPAADCRLPPLPPTPPEFVDSRLGGWEAGWPR